MRLPRWRRRPKPPPAAPHILTTLDFVRFPLISPEEAAATAARGRRAAGSFARALAVAQPLTQKEPIVTDHPTAKATDPDPIDFETLISRSGDETQAWPPAADSETTLTRIEMSDAGAHREKCSYCRGKGVVLTTSDLLRESIAMVEGSEDPVVRTFYDHLMRQAPSLAPLFPADLLDPLSPGPQSAPGERTGRGQRDKLAAALGALATTYDPGDREKMAVLDTHLATFGRAHAAFRRPDGTIKGATVSEYHYVKVTLFATLHDAAGDAWLPEYDDAWDEAYEYAARRMLAAQDTVHDAFGRYPRA